MKVLIDVRDSYQSYTEGLVLVVGLRVQTLLRVVDSYDIAGLQSHVLMQYDREA